MVFEVRVMASFILDTLAFHSPKGQHCQDTLALVNNINLNVKVHQFCAGVTRALRAKECIMSMMVACVSHQFCLCLFGCFFSEV